MSAELLVWCARGLVGRLEESSEGMNFSYEEEWLKGKDSFALSLSLPLVKKAYSGSRASNFFSNLLPEGLVRQALASRLGLSPDNDFALLKALGADCAGAIQILPQGEPPGPVKGGSARTPSLKEWQELLQTPPVMAALAEAGRLRLSLAGAQDKLPVVLSGGQPALPAPGAPSTHLLKFGSGDYAHLPANEVFCAQLARAAGLRVAQARLISVGEQEVCLVERYDRVLHNEEILRLHQEDFCQALGRSGRRKYEQEGGPGFADCFELLSEVSEEPLPDLEQLLRWLVFNLVLGNADGHAKNLSLLSDTQGRLRLAPFYDLVCTAVYGKIDRFLAMRVGGQRDPGQIGPKHWTLLAQQIGVTRKYLQNEVSHLAEKLPHLAAEQAERFEYDHGRHPILQMIPSELSRRARRVLKLLA